MFRFTLTSIMMFSFLTLQPCLAESNEELQKFIAIQQAQIKVLDLQLKKEREIRERDYAKSLCISGLVHSHRNIPGEPFKQSIGLKRLENPNQRNVVKICKEFGPQWRSLGYIQGHPNACGQIENSHYAAVVSLESGDLPSGPRGCKVGTYICCYEA